MNRAFVFPIHLSSLSSSERATYFTLGLSHSLGYGFQPGIDPSYPGPM
jgi:hypothetical protein